MKRTYYVGADKVENVESEMDLGVCMDFELNSNEERNLKNKN